MILKTYRARTMGDALAEVKRDLGRDAVILHTRSYKVGGWLGLGGKPMVEITASDNVNVMSRDGGGGGGKKPARAAKAAPPPIVLKAYGFPDPSTSPPVVPEPVVLPVAPRAAMAELAPKTPIEVPAPTREMSGSRDRLAPAIDVELASIRRMIGQVLQCSRQTALRSGPQAAAAAVPGSMPEALFQDYLKLLESEVAADIADEVIGDVRNELSSAELADGTIVHQTVLRHLASLIPADGEIPRPGPSRDGRPLTIALVGPTGVGKTTTVAKLAAAYKLRHGKRVGLVTTDTYRIAAVDQLRTYAEIIGLPVKVAMSPAEMGQALQSLADCDCILIDTAGRSQRDTGRLDELARFIAAAKPHQTHLVLASNASESSLMEAATRFASVSPDRVIFTKLDEAVNFGVLVTVAKRICLKLSYVTTGQEVPDHIEPGRPDRIARLLMDGGALR